MNHTGALASTPQMTSRRLNFITLAIFAPVLVLVGIAGFVIPPDGSLTSGAAPYNIFHIAFGLTGLLCVWSRNARLLSGFNFGFGLIDLYQALASYLHLLPEQYFLWTKVDDILHIVIGAFLLAVGSAGLLQNRDQ